MDTRARSTRRFVPYPSKFTRIDAGLLILGEISVVLLTGKVGIRTPLDYAGRMLKCPD